MPQSIDINRIVEKVLDQIAQGAKEKKNAGASANEKNNAGASPAANNNNNTTTNGCDGADDELFVADRVVALGRIERQLAGKKRLAITPGAILTPSVRDYLKEHRISICTAMPSSTGSSDPNANANSNSNSKTVLIVAALTSYDPMALVNRLAQQRFNVAVENSSCLIETTDRLAEQLADPARLGVILTSHHAAALCLANRHQNLRAVSVDCEDQLEPIVSAVGANVLIVSSRGRPCFQLERIITRFLQIPKHTCPDVLKSRLA